MAKKRQIRSVTSISVPPELKQRMDKVKEALNWSAIACQAFEQKLAEIASKREVKKMDDVIERLRASQREVESEDYKTGFENGEDWAKTTATAKQLQRIERFEEAGSGEYDHETLFYVIEPNGGGNPMDFSWPEVFGDDCQDEIESPDVIRGFVEGAMSVWREVRKHL